MKHKAVMETRQFLTRTLKKLESPSGRRALRMATERTRDAVKPFRKARDITPEKLHRRFTV
ncbi:MAG TPA: hypothetical protein VNX02_17105 [Steroidobacteraceae bacterium]|jgi:hypothetical protein|nr:hypothetical protein [Steroidobacteraceae bacterium]